MSLWDRLVAIFKREAADLKEGLTRAGDTLSEELDRKQRELDAEPHERVDMILDEIDAEDQRFDELEQRVRDHTADEDS